MPTYTALELADVVGVSEGNVRRFFRALGFPDSGDEVRYTHDDRVVLESIVKAVRGSDLDLATAVRLVRAVGQNVARMSDWQVAALASRAEEVGTDQTAGFPVSRREGAQRIADEVCEALQQVLVHSWQRHLDAALTRLDVGTDVDDEEQSTSVTVGFADLVNFSALSNELDSDRLGELVEIFEARCGDAVAAHEGRMIKTIGDSVLFVADEAQRAMDIAAGLIEVIGDDPKLPDVRIGLATGLVVTRLGDIFGPPVNLAARLTALARRNRVLVDDATVAALPPREYEHRRLTARPLRGFGLVEPVAVWRR
ncbi:adenylate/guanylate cyclase domain-containing protein [Nocardioides caldifontis]|uniref:adenylate/guanylate cyclase domain-containing protein n=1 Tax=Nocardioides caldifontis TaxID=2588938 RepID=UPI001EEF7EF6|nr:adenylate/guanylate cyclase domain-containing protein [Nocardioides caldifontis]